MQVILGSGGSIARPLATALADYTDHVRCCSRSTHALPTKDGTRYEHLSTDLLDAPSVRKAVAGAEVAYLTAGLTYDAEVWARDWPVVIDNVIEACSQEGTRLAFFDNVYALDPAEYGNMRETSPLAPTSVKGKIRQQLLDTLWRAHDAGTIQLTVVRAADFYGPGISNSLANAMIFDKIGAGSTAQWVGDVDLKHSFTYTPDAGRHLALLGNDERAWGQSWHLPTTTDLTSVREWVATATEIASQPNKLQRLPNALLWVLRLMNKDIKELWDVREQYQRDYYLNSSKFEETFGVSATPAREGIRMVLEAGPTV
ncbi:NAD-dependent epimerase/dehydratase family protein [Lewinella sp. 4G2]|uniref:NAD-dependent epimerase/dehydratase family protein n=1 Tax=Lewinella sp. 4G2 TaxID=1803372 RepID=UPI0007B4C43A|nr:NAD-dependent epimerase/dehydratase family protein [Lewinella sp. 4G2]OAV43346.1 hypothetical protein A3850_002030 [Lewinella sp. 4G2]